jgi:uncharacterized protein (TIGR03382 family)
MRTSSVLVLGLFLVGAQAAVAGGDTDGWDTETTGEDTDIWDTQVEDSDAKDTEDSDPADTEESTDTEATDTDATDDTDTGFAGGTLAANLVGESGGPACSAGPSSGGGALALIGLLVAGLGGRRRRDR